MFDDLVKSFESQIELVKIAFDNQNKAPNYFEVVDAYILVFGKLFNFIMDDLFGMFGMEEEHYKYVKETGKNLTDEEIRRLFSISAIKKSFNTPRLLLLSDDLTKAMAQNSLQQSLLLLTHSFSQISSDTFGYFSFVYYLLRTPSVNPNIRNKIMNVQRFICDLYMNSELYCFPFISYSEQFFFSLRKSSKISTNNFLNLLKKYISTSSINSTLLAKGVIKTVVLENGIQLQFLNKYQGINKGMKIVVLINDFNVEWYYKSYHLASIAKKKNHHVKQDSSDYANLISNSTPFSNSNTTVPIFGISQSFINFREPLLYVILYGLDFAPFTFFHINLYTIGGFFIISRGLSDHVLWSSFMKSNGLGKLNSEQRSCLAERVIEISILSALFGLYDLHANNIMIKILGDDISLSIIDFAYCDDNQAVHSSETLMKNMIQLIDIIKAGNINDIIVFNQSHSFLRFLSKEDYYCIFTNLTVHSRKAFISLFNRINGIINKRSIMVYFEGIINNTPLHELLAGNIHYLSGGFSNYVSFIKHQVDIIRQTMETTIKLDNFFFESSSKERCIGDYLGFTELEAIQRIAPYFFCKEDSTEIRKCKCVAELIEKLNTSISPDCGFKRRHIDRIYSYSINELEIYSQHISDCFNKLSSNPFLQEE